MIKYIAVLLVAFTISNNQKSIAQSFQVQLDSLLQVSDFNTVIGDVIEYDEEFEYEINECILSLMGFDVQVEGFEADLYIMATSTDNKLAAEYVASYITPEGYGVQDSDTDSTLDVKENAKRRLFYFSEASINFMDITFMDDGSIDIVIIHL